MLVNEKKLSGKALGERIYKEGIELWKRQKEFARLKKLKEQQEIREMMEKYYPFGHGTDMKPRGLRNLRLEGLFPNKDFLNAKRFAGTFDLGRPGGGAPIVSHGKKITRTHEDPFLRFQFGSDGDLRRWVDNTLRYKTNKKAQEEYRRELDKLVEEKREIKEKRRIEDEESIQKQFLKTPPWGKQGPGGFAWRKPSSIGHNFFKSLGWSTENTLKQLEAEGNVKSTDKNNNGKKSNLNKAKKYDPVFYPCKNVYTGSKNRKLSPLLEGKENGIELVPLLAKQRRFPLKVPLDSTDVTNQKKNYLSSLWHREGSAYLRDLTQQITDKQNKQKEMKAEDDETYRHHFDTWNGFWGRPGHGAPKSTVKKQRLDRLLYPQMVPISVH